MAEFLMPSLGADMEAGTLVEWLVKPGDAVKRGDIVAVVETQKGAIEIEIFEPGVVDRLLVEPGTEVPVGTVLAEVRGAGEGREAAPRRRREPPAPAVPETPRPVAAAPDALRPRASPLARRRAEALGLDLEAVRGSGPGGAVTVEDVERAAAAGKAPPADAKARLRQAIAAAMASSKREIPHYYLAETVDLTRLLAWLETANAARPVTGRLLYVVPLIKAVARALASFPELNGVWRDGRFDSSAAVHIGVAIALRGGGLTAPALMDVADKDLDRLMAEFRDLAGRVRAGRMRASELTAATVTVTSLGERGVETLFPVIYPPQVAIVGFGAVVARPWVVDGEVLPRRVINVSLAADHRVSDGHRGGLFLATLADLLQEPEKL
jgi:pyruvate dehydrogenase E2 component (dihydrolipoamide acetyltransferase)